MKLKKKIGGEKMENIKGKIFAGIGIVVVIAVFFVIFWLLFDQESTYYTKIVNK